MKVYVCYISYNYEACSVPEATFRNEEEARLWVAAAKEKGLGDDAKYVEFELEE